MGTFDDTDEAAGELTRREVLTSAGAAVAALALGACARPDATAAAAPPQGEIMATEAKTTKAAPMPAVYVPHGGGPWPFVDLGMGDKGELERLATYLRGIASLPATPPKALLVISAHWEEPVATVMTAERPPMLYDYYGFPPESYEITWPAPGAPALAARVRSLLAGAAFQTAADPARGFDHGTFVPLKLAYPKAEVPTVQLSLVRGLDPTTHLAMGRALAPLRDEGVFIVGSGMSFHNMGAFRAAMMGVADDTGPLGGVFDGWLHETAALPRSEREQRLARWSAAPGARAAHPREEHLLPLMVIAGLAGAEEPVTVAYADTVMGARVSAVQVG